MSMVEDGVLGYTHFYSLYKGFTWDNKGDFT